MCVKIDSVFSVFPLSSLFAAAQLESRAEVPHSLHSSAGFISCTQPAMSPFFLFLAHIFNRVPSRSPAPIRLMRKLAWRWMLPPSKPPISVRRAPITGWNIRSCFIPCRDNWYRFSGPWELHLGTHKQCIWPPPGAHFLAGARHRRRVRRRIRKIVWDDSRRSLLHRLRCRLRQRCYLRSRLRRILSS